MSWERMERRVERNELRRSESAGAQTAVTINERSERPQSARERSVSPLPSGPAATKSSGRRGEHDNHAADISRMKSGGPGGQLVAATEYPCTARSAGGLCTVHPQRPRAQLDPRRVSIEPRVAGGGDR